MIVGDGSQHKELGGRALTLRRSKKPRLDLNTCQPIDSGLLIQPLEKDIIAHFSLIITALGRHEQKSQLSATKYEQNPKDFRYVLR